MVRTSGSRLTQEDRDVTRHLRNKYIMAALLMGLVLLLGHSIFSHLDQAAKKQSLQEPRRTLCSREVRQQCLNPEVVEQLLTDPSARILTAEALQGGSTDSKLLTLAAHDASGRQHLIRAKWRSHESQSSTNAPRKEPIVYAFQQLFLDANEYVFPPARSRCFSLSEYQRVVDPKAHTTHKHMPDCVFGVVSLWLEGATPLEHGLFFEEPVFSRQRWESDAVYRRTLADGNLLTYLSLNGDSHNGNWLFIENEGLRHMYLVDSTIAFGRNGNLSLGPNENFSRLLVPSLPARTLERVLALTTDDLRSLQKIEAILRTENGEYASCLHRKQDPGETLMHVPKGLTDHELQLIEEQIWYLRVRHHMGEIETWTSEESSASLAPQSFARRQSSTESPGVSRGGAKDI